MPENPQEQSEAKLLAYVEGELDDAGRAEIERHIQANPKHRKLLDQLSAGRQLVRMLPREAAPIDLFENVQAQLERQELLSSVADVNPETGNIRLTRWGQVRAAAAIVLLASGLGLMIYNVMPKKGSGSNLAVKPDEPSTPASGTAPQSGFEEAVADRNESFPVGGFDSDAEERHFRMVRAADEARNLPAVQDALSSEKMARGASTDADKSAGSAQTLDSHLQGASTAPGPAAPSAAQLAVNASGSEALYVVVASANPSTARQDVLSLLSQGGLHYEAVATAADPAAAAGAAPAVAEPEGLRPMPEKPQSQSLPQQQGQGSPSALYESSAKDSAKAAYPGPDAGQPQSAGAAAPQRQDLNEAGKKGQLRAGTAETGPAAVQEVLIVRRVRRDHAQQLVAELNRPAQDRYAVAYGSSSQFRRGGAPAANDVADAKAKAGGKVAVAGKSAAERDRANRFANAVAGEPAAKAPAQSAEPQESPSARQLKNDDGLLEGGESGAKREANRSLSSQDRSATKAIAGTAVSQPVQQQRAAPADVAGRPAAAPMADQAAAPKADLAAGPLQANEPVELVYLDMRRNGQPIAQPMRISARGTIYVAGFGEFALTGMSPAEATTRLTSAVQAKSPASKGVIVRRPSAGNVAANGALGGGAPVVPGEAGSGAGGAARGPAVGNRADTRPTATAAPTARKPAATATPPARPPGAAASEQLRPNTPAATPPPAVNPAPAPSPTAEALSAMSSPEEDQYVDIVIVLQRDAPAGAADQR